MHEEVIKLDQDFGTSFGGILTDDSGRVRALWGSYAEQDDKVGVKVQEKVGTSGEKGGKPG